MCTHGTMLNKFVATLELDVATVGKTRSSMAKVRVKIDLLKPLVHNISMGSEDENTPLKGFTQKIEYENIHKYCRQCKKLGHNLMNCRVIKNKWAAKTDKNNKEEEQKHFEEGTSETQKEKEEEEEG